MFTDQSHRGTCCDRRGVTLIELLCVLVILAILASLLLPAIARAYSRVKGKADAIEAPAVANLLRTQTRKYCALNPKFSFPNKAALVTSCNLSSKCRIWIEDARTEFVPFSFQTPNKQVVLSVSVGREHVIHYQFTKGELSITPD